MSSQLLKQFCVLDTAAGEWGSWFKSCQRCQRLNFDLQQRTSGWPEASASNVLVVSMCDGAGKPAWEMPPSLQLPRASLGTLFRLRIFRMRFIPQANSSRLATNSASATDFSCHPTKSRQERNNSWETIIQRCKPLARAADGAFHERREPPREHRSEESLPP